MSADFDSVEREGTRYFVGHGLDVVWWYKPAALR